MSLKEYLKLQTNTFHVSHVPRYKNVIWSSSYQNKNSNYRCHSDQREKLSAYRNPGRKKNHLVSPQSVYSRKFNSPFAGSALQPTQKESTIRNRLLDPSRKILRWSGELSSFSIDSPNADLRKSAVDLTAVEDFTGQQNCSRRDSANMAPFIKNVNVSGSANIRQRRYTVPCKANKNICGEELAHPTVTANRNQKMSDFTAKPSSTNDKYICLSKVQTFRATKDILNSSAEPRNHTTSRNLLKSGPVTVPELGNANGVRKNVLQQNTIQNKTSANSSSSSSCCSSEADSINETNNDFFAYLTKLKLDDERIYLSQEKQIGLKSNGSEYNFDIFVNKSALLNKNGRKVILDHGTHSKRPKDSNIHNLDSIRSKRDISYASNTSNKEDNINNDAKNISKTTDSLANCVRNRPEYDSGTERAGNSALVALERMRQEMEDRFSQEVWYKKACTTIQELCSFRSNMDTDGFDLTEITRRLSRPIASSITRQAARIQVSSAGRTRKPGLVKTSNYLNTD